ncbi:MAG: GreA/GreB family elongation factor [Myxococcaceae bacterium]
MSTPVQTILTTSDVNRIRELLSAEIPVQAETARAILKETLSRARIVKPEAVPADVVTLDSRFVFRDEDSGRDRDGWLVSPSHADAATNRMSVLSPLGAVLFGARVGDSVTWRLPRGGERLVTVTAVLQQPGGFAQEPEQEKWA